MRKGADHGLVEKKKKISGGESSLQSYVPFAKNMRRA